MASRVMPELDDGAEQKLVSGQEPPEAARDFDPADDLPEGVLNKLRAGCALLYPELPWGSPPSWKKTGQTQTQLIIWEMTTGLGCLWVALSLPYALFIDGAKHSDYQV